MNGLPTAEAPIGVFDSGLGGLTVARRIADLLPEERILYVADQAHVPYGGRELEQVRQFACGISTALVEHGCKALVMACNISSATALTVVQERYPELPVLGVILPGARAAAAQTRTGRIGVLATEGTVRSGAYTRSLQEIKANLQVIEVACPLFVPLVESGREASSEARAAAAAYLAPLIAEEVDTVVLGCTHYPYLLPVLCNLAPHVRFIDPAEQTVCELRELLAEALLLSTHSSAPHLLMTTGATEPFREQATGLFPASSEVQGGVWVSGRLSLPCSDVSAPEISEQTLDGTGICEYNGGVLRTNTRP